MDGSLENRDLLPPQKKPYAHVIKFSEIIFQFLKVQDPFGDKIVSVKYISRVENSFNVNP